MPGNNKINEFLKKLTSNIECSERAACVEEAKRLAGEMVIGGEELLDLSTKEGNAGRHELAYILALTATLDLEGEKKVTAYSHAGFEANYLGNQKESEEHYIKAIELDPENSYAHYSYAILLMDLNRLNEAEEHLIKALESKPNHKILHYNYGVLLEGMGRYNKAEKHYIKALELDPKDISAHGRYALMLETMGRYNEAEEHFKIAIELNPEAGWAQGAYAFLLQRLKRKNEAEDHFKKALELDPKGDWTHDNYGTLLVELGRKKEAEEHYKKAIEINPRYVEAHNNYALLLQELGRKKEAEEHYKKAIELNPSFILAYKNYAVFLKNNRSFIEAETKVREWLNIYPRDVLLHITLGDILSDSKYFDKDFEMAEIEYQEAIRNSKHSNVDNMEDFRNSSSIDKIDTIRIPLFDDILISETHNKLGYVYIKLKQYGKAKKEFKKAIDSNPMNMKARRNLRKLDKFESETKNTAKRISKTQMFLVTIVFLYQIVFFYLFLTTTKISDAIFTTQSIVLFFILIIILFYHQFKSFKLATTGIEVEKSEYIIAKSSSLEAKWRLDKELKIDH